MPTRNHGIGVIGPKTNSPDYLAFIIGIKLLQRTIIGDSIKQIDLESDLLFERVFAFIGFLDEKDRDKILTSFLGWGFSAKKEQVKKEFELVKAKLIEHQNGRPLENNSFFGAEQVITSSSVARAIGEDFLKFGRRIEPDEIKSRLDEISLDDVINVMKFYLSEGNYSLMGPTKPLNTDKYDMISYLSIEMLKKFFKSIFLFK